MSTRTEQTAHAPEAAERTARTRASDTRRPWYRQLWPWLLILIPLAGVIMASITATYAFTHPDPDVRTHTAVPLDKTNWESHR